MHSSYDPDVYRIKHLTRLVSLREVADKRSRLPSGQTEARLTSQRDIRSDVLHSGVMCVWPGAQVHIAPAVGAKAPYANGAHSDVADSNGIKPTSAAGAIAT